MSPDCNSSNPTPTSSGSASAFPSATLDARERHKLAERERRKSMRELFLSLHSLLPHSSTVRKEQSAILDEIIKYIPLASARLRSLRNRSTSTTTTSSSSSSSSSSSLHDSDAVVHVKGTRGDCDIRVAPELSSSVAIRVRGDRVNVSLTDTKGGTTTTAAAQSLMPLSSVLDELESHGLRVVRSTHCRDGAKILHHSECKTNEGSEGSPVLVKERLQELACKLQKLGKSTSSSPARVAMSRKRFSSSD
ncbi:hypothetical protein QJS04_geneDACA016877 [Acorus gramineus]|uniref:BHLH domain-containing protein n=1 Tax=Acorus gramineus TaxID=55184 RepID=A0AAV9BMB0_ACOGR|nr:hypothetical protein QJS04_geneDACA016877 [Acorus gramineus]